MPNEAGSVVINALAFADFQRGDIPHGKSAFRTSDPSLNCCLYANALLEPA